MHELVIRLKSGREITVICEECSLTRNGFGAVTNIHFEGLQNIRPIILDPSQIELMYEVLQPDLLVKTPRKSRESHEKDTPQTDCPWK